MKLCFLNINLYKAHYTLLEIAFYLIIFENYVDEKKNKEKDKFT